MKGGELSEQGVEGEGRVGVTRRSHEGELVDQGVVMVRS